MACVNVGAVHGPPDPLMSKATWCDIFPNVPPDVYQEKVVSIFKRLAEEFGDVPLKVINDGEVTALAGMMMVKEGNLCGKFASKCRPSETVESHQKIDRPHQDFTELDYSSVVKVFTVHSKPNFAFPWKQSSQRSCMGSGFPISGNRLVTNAHVVAHAHLVHVRRSDGHRKFVAQVSAMCYESDLAILTVEDGAFWEGLEPLEFAPTLPRLQDEVAVVGFPTGTSGGEALCITKGVVSRIDMQHYSSDSWMLAVQIDAAINPGNSGCPCLNASGRVVGVAFQKNVNTGSENIGLIIPATVVRSFIHCCDVGAWGFGDVGFRIALLDNPSMREWLGLADCETGVLVDEVSPVAPSSQLLRPGTDVLLAIDDNLVGEDGTVALPESGPGQGGITLRVPLDWMFRRRYPGDTISLKIISNGERRTVEWPLPGITPLVPSNPLDGERLGQWPEYVLVAGLVFVPLTDPYLSEEFGSNWAKGPTALLDLAYNGKTKYKGEQPIVLSEVLACQFTQGYEDQRRGLLVECDGQRVRSLAHLATLIHSGEGSFLKLKLQGDYLIVLKRSGISAATEEIMQRHQIPKPRHLLQRDAASGTKAGI